jgi:hypothetical protein
VNYRKSLLAQVLYYSLYPNKVAGQNTRADAKLYLTTIKCDEVKTPKLMSGMSYG